MVSWQLHASAPCGALCWGWGLLLEFGAHRSGSIIDDVPRASEHAGCISQCRMPGAGCVDVLTCSSFCSGVPVVGPGVHSGCFGWLDARSYGCWSHVSRAVAALYTIQPDAYIIVSYKPRSGSDQLNASAGVSLLCLAP